MSESKHSDLSAIRAKLAGLRGETYWRSLEELADTEEFRAYLAAEFPNEAPALADPLGRRTFLRLMGASLALAGVGACTRQPEERIVPYAQAPEQLVLGQPLHFATAMPTEGYAAGVLVESHAGRPTKIEGNPIHPASRGATGARVQAAVLSLYDPDRSQTLTRTGWPSTWPDFVEALAPELEVQKLQRGKGLRLLSGAVTSPTLADQMRRVVERFPEARWHRWQAARPGFARAGARRVFGRDLEVSYDLSAADVILSLDADVFGEGPASVRYANDFAARRRTPTPGAQLNRLYVVESSPTITGAAADHRLALGPSAIVHWAGACAKTFLGERTHLYFDSWTSPAGRAAEWLAAVTADLEAHRGRSLVVAGDHQPPVIHALALLVNEALGNIGTSVRLSEPVEADPIDHLTSLGQLVADMNAGKVDLLVIIDANPVYSAPADLSFTDALDKVRTRVRLGLYEDETSALCHWHVPAAHPLEAWSDARAFDGTATILQPLIAPLYGGKTAHELLAVLLGEPGKSAYGIVREYWQSRWSAAELEARWKRALHDGVVEGTTLPPLAITSQAEPGEPPARAPRQHDRLELVFRPDPSVGDGEHANNGWLQELSKPLTKLTWDNAALLAPALAERLGVTSGDVVQLTHAGRSIEAPAWIMPGQAEKTITLHLGYGRQRAGKVGSGLGFDAYRLRTSRTLGSATDLQIKRTGKRYPLASTQHHHSMHGRDLVRVATAEQLARDPHVVHKRGHPPAKGLSLYPEHQHEGNAWGMSIDLSACIGCNACVVACQAENNIPVVGKTEVGRGREMAWLRVDRYYTGNLDNPETVHQPVPCMHCEQAPCEPVCPVGATVHSAEGLNDMVYNRCVGTRYCSNNCPYKVRRFNFFAYADSHTESLKAQRNPDVTVRARGVMEKCTYCVQRINVARIKAKKEDRPIADGEIQTACEAACPTQAITFGNIHDAKSRVAEQKSSPLSYALLEELGTKPRTTYLAKIANKNPKLRGGDE
jgi:molybdopterin-containing oxidoreductase family iron-sulfur binding subunit